jgi:hypothetical protein
MSTIVFPLPDEVLTTLGVPADEFAREVRVAAAIKLHAQGRLSVDDAARVAGLAPDGFVKVLERDRLAPAEEPPAPAGGRDPTGLLDLIDAISKRPAMFVGSASLTAVSHYIAGYQHAVGALAAPGAPTLDGWQRWVELRFEIFHPAWHWTRILLHVFGDDTAAIAALSGLTRDYLRDRTDLGPADMEAKLRAVLLARYGRDFHEPEQTRTRPLGEEDGRPSALPVATPSANTNKAPGSRS